MGSARSGSSAGGKAVLPAGAESAAGSGEEASAREGAGSTGAGSSGAGADAGSGWGVGGSPAVDGGDREEGGLEGKDHSFSADPADI